MKDVVENKTGSPGIQCLRRERAEVLASHYNAYVPGPLLPTSLLNSKLYLCLEVCPMFASDENESKHKQLVGM